MESKTEEEIPSQQFSKDLIRVKHKNRQHRQSISRHFPGISGWAGTRLLSSNEHGPNSTPTQGWAHTLCTFIHDESGFCWGNHWIYRAAHPCWCQPTVLIETLQGNSMQSCFVLLARCLHGTPCQTNSINVRKAA